MFTLVTCGHIDDILLHCDGFIGRNNSLKRNKINAHKKEPHVDLRTAGKIICTSNNSGLPASPLFGDINWYGNGRQNKAS